MVVASHPAVAALPRRVVDVGVLQSVVVALHEDTDLRAAVDLDPARRLAHSAHEDVGRVCAQRACSDVTTINGESLGSLLLAVEHPPLIVGQRGVGHEVLGGRERLPIPAEQRHAHVAVASNVAV